MDCFSDLFRHIFNQLQVNPGHYKVLLSIPQNFALTVKLKILEILFDEFGVQGVTAGEYLDEFSSRACPCLRECTCMSVRAGDFLVFNKPIFQL